MWNTIPTEAAELAVSAAAGSGGILWLGWKLFLSELVTDVRAIRAAVEGVKATQNEHAVKLAQLEERKLDKGAFLRSPLDAPPTITLPQG